MSRHPTVFLPGAHFMAPIGDEATLLQLAGQLERAHPWTYPRPPDTRQRFHRRPLRVGSNADPSCPPEPAHTGGGQHRFVTARSVECDGGDAGPRWHRTHSRQLRTGTPVPCRARHRWRSELHDHDQQDHRGSPPPEAAVDDVAPSTGSAATIVATGDFSLEWLTERRTELLAERQALTGQAQRLEDEANALLNDGETGDVKFDDEGAEGDGMALERDRDLMLSAQARETVAEIDAALDRMAAGTYGYSVQSGRPIPHDRLEAIPWATLLVEEKRGGIGSW